VTAQTVSSAVARRDAGAAELVRQSRDWFRAIVPSHVDANAFVALSIGYLRKNPKLAAAAVRNPQAFTAALSECARLGLVPGDTYHLVPFENTRNDTVDITGITDYKGEIELIYRAGAVASVKAEIVRKRDHFRYTTDMDRPEHSPDWFGDRGDLIGAYAYAVMKDGATSKVVIYSRAEIDEVRAASKGANRSDSPWNNWYDRMALKTVIHRLEHFVPTSAEYRREQLRAAAEVSQQVNSAAPPRTEAMPAPAASEQQVVDAEIVEEPPARKPDRSSRGRQRREPQAPPPEDAPWPGDAAPARTEHGTPAAHPGQPDDPRDAVIWHLDRIGIVAHQPQMDVLTQAMDRPVTGADGLAGEEAVKLAERLAWCNIPADVDTLLRTGEVPGDGQ